MKTRQPDRTTPWLTTAGAAAYTASSEKTVLRGVKSGTLRHVRLAGNLRLRFRREWCDEWLLGDARDTESSEPASTEVETRPLSIDRPSTTRERAGNVKQRVQ